MYFLTWLMDWLEFYCSILKAVGALLINFCVGIERNSTMLREHTLDDFNPLKYITGCFMTQHMVNSSQCLICIWKTLCILSLLNAVFYIKFLEYLQVFSIISNDTDTVYILLYIYNFLFLLNYFLQVILRSGIMRSKG